MLDPLLVPLRRLSADPTHLAQHVRDFLTAYWAGPHDAMPWDTPLQEAIHWLGDDLQNYQPVDAGPVEPTLLHDADVLARTEAVLRLADEVRSEAAHRAPDV